jgi:DNA-directed RNA polymerase subunit K/omega
LGTRAQQIAEGAPPMIKLNGLYEALEIARKELRQGVIPIVVLRIRMEYNFRTECHSTHFLILI